MNYVNTNIRRDLYTKQLKEYANLPLIKVITGIRRSGKSALLELLREDILKVTDLEHIISINFEDLEFDFISDYKKLHEYVLSQIKDDRMHYVLLDEIQNIDQWEKAVNSLRLKNTDIYITGSNSNILSSELSTFLAGRYVEFRLYTLSFAEFIDFRKTYGIGSEDIDDELDAYIRIGGFPVLSKGRFGDGTAGKVIADINNSAILRDVVQRNKIRNVQLLQKLIAFIYDNIGNITTVKSIADHFKKERRTADYETIHNYLKYLEDALIINKIQRYDIRGRRLLDTYDKYYLTEHSLQYSVREYNAKNINGILENIVCLELMRRGFSVSVGELGDKEIDFIAEKHGRKLYIQVCYLFAGKDTIEREFSPLKKISDNYPKIVVTMDEYWNVEEEGIRGMHLRDFLLSDFW
ncbi:MAG: ATP-binding protein [Candidatus Methanoplasma sp.]|jgi:predicted AAA+ superfamily ATPase|nr:ATP-binding protein [Candidatus Methanoplasma sp.]